MGRSQALHFTVKQQCRFVWALSVVHNFTKQHGQIFEGDEELLQGEEGEEASDIEDEAEAAGDNSGIQGGGTLSSATMVAFRRKRCGSIFKIDDGSTWSQTLLVYLSRCKFGSIGPLKRKPDCCGDCGGG